MKATGKPCNKKAGRRSPVCQQDKYRKLFRAHQLIDTCLSASTHTPSRSFQKLAKHSTLFTFLRQDSPAFLIKEVAMLL